MATVIDSLVVEFGLDPSRFTRGQRELLDKMGQLEERGRSFGENVEHQGKRVVDVLGAMTRGGVGLVGTFLGGTGVAGLELVIEKITNLDAATGRLSRTINMDATSLYAWGQAAKQVGGSAETMYGTLKNISADITRFSLTGQSDLITKSRFLGPLPSLARAMEGEVNPQEFMFDVVRRLDEMNIRGARRRSALELLGFDETSVNLAMGSLDQLKQRLREVAAAAPTGEEIARAERFSAGLGKIGTTALDVARKITGSTVAALAEFMSSPEKAWNDTLEEMKKGWNSFVEFLKDPATGYRAAWEAVKAAVMGEGVDFGSLFQLHLTPGGLADRAAKALGFTPKAKEADNNPGNVPMGTAVAIMHGGIPSPDNPDLARFPTPEAGLAAQKAYEAAKAKATGSIAPGGATMGESFEVQDFDPQGVPIGPVRKIGPARPDIPSVASPDMPPMAPIAPGGTGVPATTKKPTGGLPTVPKDEERAPAFDIRNIQGSLPIGATAMAAIGGGRGGDQNTISHESNVTVGSVVVNTPATDAEGIARDIKPAIERLAFATHANYGQT